MAMFLVLESTDNPKRYYRPEGPTEDYQQATTFVARYQGGQIVTQPELPKEEGWDIRHLEIRLL